MTFDMASMRVAQVRSVAMLAPVMIAAFATIAAFMTWVHWGTVEDKYILAWHSAVLAVKICFYFLWRKHRKRTASAATAIQNTTSQKAKRGTRSCYITNLLALTMGIVWGAAVVLFSRAESPEFFAVLSACFAIVLMLGGGWFSLVPTASIAFATPMFLAGTYALVNFPVSRVTVSLFVLLALLCFITPMIVTLYSKMISALFTRMQLTKRKMHMANILLEKLQEDSTDWVWETDKNSLIKRLPSELTQNIAQKNIDLGSMTLIGFLRRVVAISGTQIDELETALEMQTAFKDLLLCINIDGNERWLRLSGHPLYDAEGAFAGFVGTGSDVTLERLTEDRIVTLSQNDSLTGLMNRGAFAEQLEKAVAKLERYGRPFSVLYLDLDNFKLINDTRGHLFGDRLLAEASERIEDEVREVDCVARLGGDEFAILLEEQGDAGSAARLAARLLGEVCKPYIIDGEEFKVGLSIGIALAPLNGTRPDQLLRNADLALYRAKADGRGVFRFFENSMDAEMRERRMLESELRKAIDNEEMVLHFQPLVSSTTGATVGMESLIRWEHPIRGLLSPIEFIELAESNNLISDIGRWTLDRACMEAVAWPENIFVAINVSAYHFMKRSFLVDVRQALEKSGLPAHRLELEITESLLIENPSGVIAKLKEINNLGISVAMDDFGTGYSSLSYLMSVPFDKLKIDKSFVDEISDNESGQKIVRMITKLASELGLLITAEGVEYEDQARFLANVGCDTLQGYLFSKPMHPELLPSYFLNEVKLLSKKKTLDSRFSPASKTEEAS